MATKNKDRNFGQKLWHYRKEIFIGILLTLCIIFLVKNSESVEFHMIFWKAQVPLIILLLGFGIVGALIVGIYWLMSHREKKRDIKDLEKRIRELEHDLMVAKKSGSPKAPKAGTAKEKPGSGEEE